MEQYSSTECCGNYNDEVNEIYRHIAMAHAPLAIAYVPFQTWERPMDLCHSLQAGTIFSSLNKPFCGKGGKRW